MRLKLSRAHSETGRMTMPTSIESDQRVAELSAAIRKHLGTQPPVSLSQQVNADPCEGLSNEQLRPVTAAIDYEQMLAGLRLVSDYSHLCMAVPGLRRIPRPLRPIGRFVARCLLAATRFLFERQRAFNFNTAATLNSLQGVLYYLEQVQAENMRRMETVLGQHQMRIEELEARIRQLDGERRRAAG